MKNELTPIKKQNTYEHVLGQLQQLIETGKWKPGQKLPSEKELTEMLAVGRTSVREALRMLEAMGYIYIRPGEGSFVQEKIIVPVGLQRFFKLMQGGEYMMQLMETREMIESQIAFLAAESATPEDVLMIEEILQRKNDEGADTKLEVQRNAEFHVGLANITGNQVLVELQQLLFKLSSANIANLFSIEGRPEESVQQHAQILEAVKAHQTAEAHRLMLEHLRSRYRTPRK